MDKLSNSHQIQKSHFNRNVHEQPRTFINNLLMHENLSIQNMRHPSLSANRTCVFLPVPVLRFPNIPYHPLQPLHYPAQQNYLIQHPIDQRSYPQRQRLLSDAATSSPSTSSISSTSTNALNSYASSSSFNSQQMLSNNCAVSNKIHSHNKFQSKKTNVPTQIKILDMSIAQLQIEANKTYILGKDKTHLKINNLLKVIKRVFELQKSSSNHQYTFYSMAENIFQDFYESVFFADISDDEKCKIFNEAVHFLIDDRGILLNILEYKELYCALRMAILDLCEPNNKIQDPLNNNSVMKKSSNSFNIFHPHTIHFKSVKLAIENQRYELLKDYLSQGFIHTEDIPKLINELIQIKLNQNFKNISDYELVNRIFHIACDRLAICDNYSTGLITVSKTYWKHITYLNYSRMIYNRKDSF